MKCEKLFKEIENLNAEYMDFLFDVCNTESQTIDKEGVDKVGKLFIEKAKKEGFKIEVFPQEVAGDVVVITMNENSKEKPLCVSAHMDTVHPKGLFGYPPVKEDGDYLVGPGLVDCKGGAVAALMAMKALKTVGYDKRPVMLLLQSDEETGSSTSKRATINYICEKSKEALAFLNLEGHSPNAMCLERKGILRFKFTVKGKACHSSHCYEGVNAVTEASHKIIKLEEMKDPQGLTCNCGVINGGTVANSVAEVCTFIADIRFSTKEQMDYVREYVKKIASENVLEGATSVVEEISSRPAMEKSQKNYDLADKLNQIYKENGLPVLTKEKYFGGSDTAYTTNYGIPSIDCLGTEGEFIHSERERMKKSSLVSSAKRVASAFYCFDD